MNKVKGISFWTIGLLIICGMAAADLLCGDAAAHAEVIWLLRAPRVATAILAGAALAAAGIQMQSIFRNPLADPHIMGVSSGASAGAAVATLCGTGGLLTGNLTLAASAFIGALAAASVITVVSKRFRSAETLLIFGVMLGFIVNAIISIMQYSSDAESLKLFYSWSAGSFSNTSWTQVGIMSAALALGTAIASGCSKGLDIILFGDEFAEIAGADTGRIRRMALLSSCIMTGAITAYCGPLGFVGITAPHIARSLIGTSAHRKAIPAALLTGSIISLGADLISQLSPSPLPTASTMALIGIPIILYILIKRPSL